MAIPYPKVAVLLTLKRFQGAIAVVLWAVEPHLTSPKPFGQALPTQGEEPESCQIWDQWFTSV